VWLLTFLPEHKERNTPTFRAARFVVGDDENSDGEVSEPKVQDDLHPALSGLLRTLPAPGQPMSIKERERFLKAFEAILSFAHPTDEEQG
jgi:hypothetical protein